MYLFECNLGWKSIHHDNDLYGMTGKERWESYYKNKTEGHGWGSAKKQMQGKVTMLKKLIRSKSGSVCG